MASVKPFPFEQLPKELRMQVLMQTNLVARPRKEDDIFQGGVFIGDRDKWRFNHGCCKHCSNPPENCRCIWQSNSFSQTCTCSSDPRPMLLVSRAFHQDASEILLSNRLIIQIGLSSQEARPKKRAAIVRTLVFPSYNKQEAILRFFQHKSSSTLRLMRSITFDLGWLAYDLWDQGRARFVFKWDGLVEIIAAHCNLAALILTLRCDPDFDGEIFATRQPFTGTAYAPVEYFYDDILTCLRRLKGLKVFVVYLRHEKYRELERSFEKDVMGEDYNSDNWRVPRDISFRV